MISIIKVTGNSLSPFFLPGDFAVTIKTPWMSKKLQAGDIIVFNHSKFGVLVKKITSIDTSKQFLVVSGTHPDSIDPKTIGSVNIRDVIGKVIWHIKNPRI